MVNAIRPPISSRMQKTSRDADPDQRTGPNVSPPAEFGHPSAPFVVGGLLEFGHRIGHASRRGASERDLVGRDPFAFLIAVLLDQGVPATRAWEAPSRLLQRLGSIDPAFLVIHQQALARAMRLRPMPHRYPSVATRWILAAATLVIERYRGDAGRIWDEPVSAAALRRRFEAFRGVGQKKAAMAVEILRSDGVGVKELTGSDVAYDIHVRRVFLRTKLASVDTLESVVGAARRYHPQHPAALDLPAWTIGRTWCRPNRPKCDLCPIAWACPSAPVEKGAGKAT